MPGKVPSSDRQGDDRRQDDRHHVSTAPSDLGGHRFRRCCRRRGALPGCTCCIACAGWAFGAGVKAGSGVGGTWYWNRYRARVATSSMQYSFSFSEMDQEWDWSEEDAPQPEILAYVNHVADRFDLRRLIEFDTRVTARHVSTRRSKVLEGRDRCGDRVTAKFASWQWAACRRRTGRASRGWTTFGGPVYRTGEWPHEGVDFTGLRVGIIGTGSSAIQSIPIIAQQAAGL